MRVAIIIAMAIALVASGVIPTTGAVRGHPKPRQPTYHVYFPNISAPRDAGISLVRVVVTCGHVAAVTRIPDDWYGRTLRPASEFEPEWNEFRFAEQVQGDAGEDMVEKQNAEQGLMPVLGNEAAEYGYESQNRYFVQCFLNGTQPEESFYDGLEVTELMMTAYMSAEQERTIPTLPIR